MTTQTAIEKATQAGWDETVAYVEGYLFKEIALLDPQFWSCLGKAMGLSEEKFYQFDIVHPYLGLRMPEWKWYWKCLIDDLSEGKTIEQFFEQIN